MRRALLLCLLLIGLGFLACLSRADDSFSMGPVYDRLPLIIPPGPGSRIEAVGPFFYSEKAGDVSTWAVPPLMSHTTDPSTHSEEFDLLYPLLTLDRFDKDYRWQFLQVFSFSGGEHQPDLVA